MMKSTSKILVVSALAILSLVWPVTWTAMAQSDADCLRPRAAQEASVSGQILPKEQIYVQNGLSPQEVIALKVCRQQGQLYYVLTVDKGQSADIVWINAQTGLG